MAPRVSIVSSAKFGVIINGEINFCSLQVDLCERSMDVMGVVGSEECLRTMKLFISNPVWGCWVDSLADVSEEVSGDGI